MRILTKTVTTSVIICVISVVVAFVSIVIAEADPPGQTAEASEQKAVLVTGASTGIGRKTTEMLAAKGVFVYAGARKEKDLKELDAIENVQSIRLDVTVQ